MENKENSVNLTLDLEWFAVDQDGHIGYFTSAGQGPIPSSLCEGKNQLEIQSKYFQDVSHQSIALVLKREGMLQDWIKMAEHGLYAYDFIGHYEIVARPSIPILITQVDLHIKAILEKTIISNYCFTTTPQLLPHKINDIEWVWPD